MTFGRDRPAIQLSKCTKGQVRVELMGGLGNQLFQFSVVVALAMEYNFSFKFLEPRFGRKFSLQFLSLEPSVAYAVSELPNSLVMRKVKDCADCDFSFFQEQNFTYNKIDLVNSHTNLLGYFQSLQYFKSYADQIRQFIRNALPLDACSASNVVHLRIGDYLKAENKKVHPLVTNQYIRKATRHLGQDFHWDAVTDSPILANFLYLPNRLLGLQIPIVQRSSIFDFCTMINAKNLVIANSSFSWWAAFLSNANVVAPTRWFNEKCSPQLKTQDLYLNEWKLI